MPATTPAGESMATVTGAEAAAVRLDHVTKSFGSRKVLDDVSFEVPSGDGFVILGRSGTGKSVTLRHMIGLLRPDQRPRLHRRRRDQRARADRDCRRCGRRWAFCFRTRRSSIRFRSAKTSRFPCAGTRDSRTRRFAQRAEERLAAVGLERDYDKMPGALSGGMRKRAGLARALALDPQILLVDEPSAGLDPITADEIDTLLLEMKEKRGVTLVVVTHNMPSASRLGDRTGDAARGPHRRARLASRVRPQSERARARVHDLAACRVTA